MLDHHRRRKRLQIALALFGALLLIGLAGSSAASSALHQTVVSLTFDDGRASQETALIPLQSHNMHATFYLNSNSIGGSAFLTWAQVNALAAAGNEIGGHTLDHVNLPVLFQTDPTAAQIQVCSDRAALLTNVPGTSVTSFSYPFGSSDTSSAGDTAGALKAIVAGCGYTSARITQGILGSAPWCVTAGCPYAETIPPWDAFDVRATGSVTDTTTLAQLESFVTNAEQNGGGWVPFVFHDIGVDSDGYSISAANFAAFLDFLSAQESNGVIVRTVGEVMSGAANPPAPGPNVLQNPSFENMTAPNDSYCWEKTSYGTSAGDWTSTTDAHSGATAFLGTITSWTNGDRKLIVTRSSACAPAVIPGHTYRLTGWYKGTLTPYFAVYWADGSGAFQPLATSPEFPQTDSWHQAAWTTPPAPAGATAFSVGFAVTGGAGQIVIDDLALGDTAGPPPTVQLSAPGAGAYVSGRAVTLAADASDSSGIQNVKFAVDGDPIATETSNPYSYDWDSTSVADGPYTVTATATNTNDLQSSDARSFHVDNTPPESSIACDGSACGSGIYPHAVSTTLAATDSGAGVAAIRYTLDGSEPTGSSPLYSDALTVSATTTVRWRAWDAVGNEETAQSRQIRINEPPTVGITSPAPGSYVSGRSVTLSANASDDMAIASVEIAIDGTPVGFVTSPPYSLSWNSTTVGDGSHTLTAVATDQAGAQSSDSLAFTVDNTAPDATITSGPNNPTNSSTASFAFASADPSARFLCSLDGAAYARCVSPQAHAGLADGAHTFSVEAVDPAGNVSGVAVRGWLIDTTPPTGSLVAPAHGAFVRGTVTLQSDSADSGSGVKSVTFQVAPLVTREWRRAATVTTAPWKVSLDLAYITYRGYLVKVVTRDRAGNEFVSSVRKIKIDNAVPTSSITCNKRACRGVFSKPVRIRIEAHDLGSGVRTIRYTLDGRNPTSSSRLFEAPFSLATTKTIRWRVWDEAGNASPVRSRVIRIAPLSGSRRLK